VDNKAFEELVEKANLAEWQEISASYTKKDGQ
jgi:hypothetical protein